MGQHAPVVIESSGLVSAMWAASSAQAVSDSGFDWVRVLLIALPVVFGAIGTAVGYEWKARVDRRTLPDIELLKALLQDRRRELDELEGMLFNLDHWIRNRIPEESGRKRREFVRRAIECAQQSRERSRNARGFTQEEKIQLIELVRRETDAAKDCLAVYERREIPFIGRMKAPNLEVFDTAQKDRLAFTSKLSNRLPS